MADKFTKCILTVWPHNEIKRFDSLPVGCIYVAGQNEMCGETNKEHYQAYVQSDQAHPRIWFQKLVSGVKSTRVGREHTSQKANLSKFVHVTPVLIDNGAHDYPLKDDTYMNDDSKVSFGKYEHANKHKTEEFADAIIACSSLYEALRLPNAMKHCNWVTQIWNLQPPRSTDAPKIPDTVFKWQNDIIQIVQEHKPDIDNRVIHFVVDGEGGCGKSTLCQILIQKFGAVMMKTDNGAMIRDLCAMYQKEPIVLFDMARKSNPAHWPWTLMEDLKNGCLTVGKYMPHNVLFKSPCIVVFTNTLPDIGANFTHDRIKVHMLTAPRKEHANLTLQAGGAVDVGIVSDDKPWGNYGQWSRDLDFKYPLPLDKTVQPMFVLPLVEDEATAAEESTTLIDEDEERDSIDDLLPTQQDPDVLDGIVFSQVDSLDLAGLTQSSATSSRRAFAWGQEPATKYARLPDFNDD